MSIRRLRALIVPLALAVPMFIGTSTLPALINPKFTPVDLVKESKAILVLKFDGEAKAGKVTAKVIKVLKGDFAAKNVEVVLAGATKPDQIRLVEQGIAVPGDAATPAGEVLLSKTRHGPA